MDAPTRWTAFASLTLLVAPLTAGLGGASLLDRSEPSVDGVEGALASDAELEEVVVTTDGPPGPVAQRAEDAGAETVWTYDLIDAFAATVAAEDRERLQRVPGVDTVWPSTEVHTMLNNSVKDVQATSAWNESITGSNVSVAILDTGIDRTDPAFQGAISACVSTVDGVVLPECSDSHGHGTHVAGIAASRHDDYTGVAHGADVAAVRVLHAAGSGTTADVIAGLEWVAENADATDPPIRVASLSLGTTSEECGDGSSPVAEAADALVAEGVNVTVAAGNSGHEECTVNGLAAAENVTTVGAVDDKNTPDPMDDTLAEFSSGGPTEDGRLKPELVAPGVKIWSPYLGPTIANLDGTSMATPHVAGTVAMLAEEEPGMTPAEVKDRLTSTTTAPDNASDLPNNDWGHGLLDASSALGLNSSTSQPTQAATDAGEPRDGPPEDVSENGDEQRENRTADDGSPDRSTEAAASSGYEVDPLLEPWWFHA